MTYNTKNDLVIYKYINTADLQISVQLTLNLRLLTGNTIYFWSAGDIVDMLLVDGCPLAVIVGGYWHVMVSTLNFQSRYIVLHTFSEWQQLPY